MNIKYLSLTLVLVLFIGCGGSSSSPTQNDGKGAIDLAEYYPDKSMTKSFVTITRDGVASESSFYQQIVEVLGQSITFTEDTVVVQKVVISDTNITRTEDNETTSQYRHVDIADTLFTDTFQEVKTVDVGKTIEDTNTNCKLLSKVEQFEQGDNKYSGDLLKIECIRQGTFTTEVRAGLIDVVRDDVNGSHTIYDKSYVYLKKGLGVIATVDNDCLPNENLLHVNDNEKICGKELYSSELYLPSR